MDGFRIYNPAIGKFLSVDPLTRGYPWYTPYQFAGNKPIANIDVDGLEPQSKGKENEVRSAPDQSSGVSADWTYRGEDIGWTANTLPEVTVTSTRTENGFPTWTAAENSYTQVTSNTLIVRDNNFATEDAGEYRFILPRDFGSWGKAGSDGLIWKGCLACHAENGAYHYAAYNSQERLGGYLIVATADIVFAGVSSLRSIAAKGVTKYADGTFSISNWKGYPNGPRPSGTFRLLEGAEYNAARKLANKTNASLRKANPSLYKGKQIHEIKPVKYGGSPTDPANKIALTPKEHTQYTTFWNRIMREINK